MSNHLAMLVHAMHTHSINPNTIWRDNGSWVFASQTYTRYPLMLQLDGLLPLSTYTDINRHVHIDTQTHARAHTENLLNPR